MHREDDKRVGLLSYIKGERAGREAHDLEREAMQDPFLSDALDGYDNTADPELDTRLQRMAERVGQYGSVPVRPVAAAAMMQDAAPANMRETPAMMREMPAMMQEEMPEPDDRSGSAGRRRKVVLWLSAAAVVLFVSTLSYLTVERSVRYESLMSAEMMPESAVCELSESLEMTPELDAAPASVRQIDMTPFRQTDAAKVNGELAAVADSYEEPKPADGYKVYYDELYKGIEERWVRISEENWIVVLSFDIDESGRPTNFVVHSSPSPEFAESLIELMKSSCDWTPPGHIPVFVFVY